MVIEPVQHQDQDTDDPHHDEQQRHGTTPQSILTRWQRGIAGAEPVAMSDNDNQRPECPGD
ncbi:hypothetical protein [Streptomyces anthocyanicus]|uniref:hypothetical protein n=1 Tax=Streptomyces anthocyanicus TaxID=68174 RepID=UPI00380536B9